MLVRAADPRVAESLRHLLAATEGVRVVDGRRDVPDVVVHDVGGDRSGGEPSRAHEGIGPAALVVIGSEAADRREAASAPATVYLDRSEVADRLPAAVLEAAPGRAGASSPAATWPRILLVVGAAFLGPWLVWFSRIAQDHGVTSWHVPQGLALWSIPPLLAAAVAVTSGRAGLKDLGSRLVRVRVPARTWAAALLVPVAIAAASAAVVAALGRRVPVGELMTLPQAALYLVYGTGLFLLTEEAAWRGALLPRVGRRVGTAAAALVVGVVWAVWHLPLLATSGAADRGQPLVPFALLVVSTSVLVTALVQSARESVVVAAVFHASFDASYSWSGVVGQEHAMLWVAAVVTTGLAGVLLGVRPVRRRWAPPAARGTVADGSVRSSGERRRPAPSGAVPLRLR